MWIFENEFHRASGKEGIAGLEIQTFMADWLRDALVAGRVLPREGVVRIVRQHEGVGPYEPGGRPVLLPGRYEGR